MPEMKDGALMFSYEPIPHTDTGIIFCEGFIQLSARVVIKENKKEFSIEYDGEHTPEIEAALQQMHEWYYYNHVRNAEDNEF